MESAAEKYAAGAEIARRKRDQLDLLLRAIEYGGTTLSEEAPTDNATLVMAASLVNSPLFKYDLFCNTGTLELEDYGRLCLTTTVLIREGLFRTPELQAIDEAGLTHFFTVAVAASAISRRGSTEDPTKLLGNLRGDIVQFTMFMAYVNLNNPEEWAEKASKIFNLSSSEYQYITNSIKRQVAQAAPLKLH